MQGKRPDLDQRIQNAVFGLPLVRPDEQHRCLGTFYERIELRISFAEALKYNCSGVLQRLLKENSKYQLLINGQLDMDIMGQYIQSAKQMVCYLQLETVSITVQIRIVLQLFYVLIML